MWHRPHHHQQQCGSMEHSQPCNHRGALHETPVGWHLGRCTPQSPSQLQRAHLHFPPPPNYPPPMPSTSKMAEDHFLSVPGPSSQVDAPWPSVDYSYAYYEPGPPTKHTNVPSKYPGAYREGTYRTRHTYLTRYGTEENIYEEISDIARARRQQRNQAHQESIMSLNQSLVEEEVRRVQSGHRRVLGELNLSVEAMLMPSNSREGSDDTDRENEMDDQLADLLTVGPTDDLLSPVPLADLDSGFSGSSSGASYRSAAGSLRRGLERPKSSNSLGGLRTSTAAEAQPNKGFWGKKAWKKIAAFPSNISLNKNKVDELKTKWRGLRDTFRKEFNKSKKQKSGDGAESVVTSKWAYYKMLLFLSKTVERKKLHGNVSPQKENDNKSDSETESTLEVADNRNSQSTIQESSQQISNTDIQQPSTSGTKATSTFSTPSSISLQRKKNINNRPKYAEISKTKSVDDKFLEIERAKLEILSQRKNREDTDSEHQFLMSLLPFLKAVPRNRQMLVRSKLQQVFIDEELSTRHMPESSYSCNETIISTPLPSPISYRDSNSSRTSFSSNQFISTPLQSPSLTNIESFGVSQCLDERRDVTDQQPLSIQNYIANFNE